MRTDRTPAALRIAALIAAVAVLTTGCTPKEDQVTPEQARDSLTTITHDTADLFDYSGWQAQSDPYAGSCDNGNGVNWAYGYVMPIPDSAPLEDAQTVADYWKTLDMDVRINTDHEPVVFATGGPLKGISFETGPGSYSISGTSLCAPGDADDFR